MRPVHTITASELRGINRSAVLEIIRRDSPILRSIIAEQLRMSIPTVMRIVDELINAGLVRPSGLKERSGGRKRPLLEFNGASNLVVGVDLGGTEYYGAVADLKGKILYEDRLPSDDASAELNYNILLDFIQQLLMKANGTGQRVLGVGVGVPGVADPDKGTGRAPDSLLKLSTFIQHDQVIM
jgi:glucokinase